MTWLVPGSAGLVIRGFCQDCAPRGPVAEVACVYCGDGPLLTGELAGVDPITDPGVAGWLSSHDWQLNPGPTCPRCLRRRRR
ncbi:hypothetical protein ACFQE5_14665 [Pseudonocardia hispaniensis]|uniref:Uncharacterized protein n=1 Tax=Pseudonocardia hispaniensis TaxID=904933 RepID=A0ABW1J4P3_9PSEU